MSDKITITLSEIKEIIKENDISPHKLFGKEDFLADEALMKRIIAKEEYEEEKLKEALKKEEDSLIPDDEPSGEKDEDYLIPD